MTTCSSVHPRGSASALVQETAEPLFLQPPAFRFYKTSALTPELNLSF